MEKWQDKDTYEDSKTQKKEKKEKKKKKKFKRSECRPASTTWMQMVKWHPGYGSPISQGDVCLEMNDFIWCAN